LIERVNNEQNLDDLSVNHAEEYVTLEPSDMDCSPHVVISPPEYSESNAQWASTEDIEESEEYMGLDLDDPSAENSTSKANSLSVPLSGRKLELSFLIGGRWRCPFCVKQYSCRKVWRNHISRKHHPFLLHLKNEIPPGHVCKEGQCLLPGSQEIFRSQAGRIEKRPDAINIGPGAEKDKVDEQHNAQLLQCVNKGISIHFYSKLFLNFGQSYVY
jgi:hypothetical protein